jgi:uncharacterized protein YndB with AHSA1/START domain
MDVARSTTISRPADQVFTFVSTPENDPKWVPVSLRHEKTSPGPMQVGTRTEEDLKFLGRGMRYVWEVTAYEPPHLLTYRTIAGPLPFTIRLALEPAGSATRLTLGTEVDLPGLLKLVSAALQWVIGRQFEGELRTLKGLLEGGA